MDNVLIRSPKTPNDWSKYDDFRWDILRKPLKLSHIPLKDDLEDISTHLMAVDNQESVIACGRIHMNTSNEAQIRYVGVSLNHRRTGLGSKMIDRLESIGRVKGAKKIVLNARAEAIKFYESLGYIETGPYESDIKIPHSSMEKLIY
ncbi:GNAT family N-acetyltransferase [Gammaproteobacteria bacterium]|nr:GNAT family N-acetyltransferase [Gammaproteobacteria bacterium]MDA9040102.1 GNAT family N-acetyltransferase [Gammaproteobacteria bacterium]